MATPTPNLGLIKPGPTDPFNWGTMNTNYDTIDAAANKVGTTGTFTAGADPNNATYLSWASGWSASDAGGRIRRFGQWGYLYLRFEKNAIITIPASNDIAQQTVATLTTAWMPMNHTPFKSLAAGRMCWGYLDKDTGNVTVSSISGGNAATSLAANSMLTMACYYVLKNP